MAPAQGGYFLSQLNLSDFAAHESLRGLDSTAYHFRINSIYNPGCLRIDTSTSLGEIMPASVNATLYLVT